jgi:hypothetical protein
MARDNRDGDDEPLDIDRGMDDTIARIEARQCERRADSEADDDYHRTDDHEDEPNVVYESIDDGKLTVEVNGETIAADSIEWDFDDEDECGDRIDSEGIHDSIEEFERIEAAVEDIHEDFVERLGELGKTIEVTIGDSEVSWPDGKTVDVPSDGIQVPAVDLDTVKEVAEVIHSGPPEFNLHFPEAVPNRDELLNIDRDLDDTIARIEARQHGCEDETGNPRGQPAINIRGGQHGREDETGGDTEDGEAIEWPPEDADMTLVEALRTAPDGTIVYTGRCSNVGDGPLVGPDVTKGRQ